MPLLVAHGEKGHAKNKIIPSTHTQGISEIIAAYLLPFSPSYTCFVREKLKRHAEQTNPNTPPSRLAFNHRGTGGNSRHIFGFVQ